MFKNNGRVDTVSENNFQPYHITEPPSNKSCYQEAIKSVHSDNPLARLFFSRENMDALQQGIRYLVFKKSCEKHVIGNQSDIELSIVMRSVYLQYAEFKPFGLLEQVRELNNIVLNYCVDKVLQEIRMYQQYKTDISQLPVPMDRGEFVSAKGTKVLENKNF